MTDKKSNDPLHGVTLEMMLTGLVAHYGWEAMGRMIHIRCFNNDPSIRIQPPLSEKGARGREAKSRRCTLDICGRARNRQLMLPKARFMKDVALFTDASVNPILKIGVGACLVLPASFLTSLFRESIRTKSPAG